MRRLIIVTTSNVATARNVTNSSFSAEYNTNGDSSSATHYGAEVDEALGNKIILRLTNANTDYFDKELSIDQNREDKLDLLNEIEINPRTNE